MKLDAANRLLASLRIITADAFEGWVNTLQYSYTRPNGKDYVIVDAPFDKVRDKLRSQDWGPNRGVNPPNIFMKGKHQIQLIKEDNKTRIIDLK